LALLQVGARQGTVYQLGQSHSSCACWRWVPKQLPLSTKQKRCQGSNHHIRTDIFVTDWNCSLNVGLQPAELWGVHLTG